MDLYLSKDAMIEAYHKKVGKGYLDGTIIYEKGKGFITYSIVGDKLLIPDLYGDGKYWLAKAIELGRELGCTKLVGGTSRNVKAYNKLFGTKVIGYILEKDL